jgi:hypothetical protein
MLNRLLNEVRVILLLNHNQVKYSKYQRFKIRGKAVYTNQIMLMMHVLRKHLGVPPLRIRVLEKVREISILNEESK